MKRMGITEILRRVWLFSANKIKSSESGSKQPTQLTVELNSSLRHIIVTQDSTRRCDHDRWLFRHEPKAYGDQLGRHQSLGQSDFCEFLLFESDRSRSNAMVVVVGWVATGSYKWELAGWLKESLARKLRTAVS